MVPGKAAVGKPSPAYVTASIPGPSRRGLSHVAKMGSEWPKRLALARQSAWAILSSMSLKEQVSTLMAITDWPIELKTVYLG